MASDAVQNDGIFSRLAAARPGDARLWLARAHWLSRLGRRLEAAEASATAARLDPNCAAKDTTDYSRALELAPDSSWIANYVAQQDEVFPRVVNSRPGDLRLWSARAEWMGRRGAWLEASTASKRLVELDPGNANCWFRDAPLRLQVGDVEGYRRDCREMLTRFQSRANHYVADFTAKTCFLLPDSVPDLEPALKLARRSLAGTEKDIAYRWFLVCKALAEYRAGQFDAAVKAVSDVAPVPEGSVLDATSYIILALAQIRQGHPAEAGQTLARARGIRDRNWPQFDRGQRFDDAWDDWLRCDILQREAESLINGKAQPGPR
jgi:tetratricopeptide (TPR) repeat protein